MASRRCPPTGRRMVKAVKCQGGSCHQKHGRQSCQLPGIVLTSPAGGLQIGNCCLRKAAQRLHSVCLQTQM